MALAECGLVFVALYALGFFSAWRQESMVFDELLDPITKNVSPLDCILYVVVGVNVEREQGVDLFICGDCAFDRRLFRFRLHTMFLARPYLAAWLVWRS